MTSTELGYLSGVTSNIQDQLNGKVGSSTTAYLANLELTGGSDHGGYIDFHYNGSSDNYTARIIQQLKADRIELAVIADEFSVKSADGSTSLIASYNGNIWFSNLCVDNNFGDTLPSRGKNWGTIFFLKS